MHPLRPWHYLGSSTSAHLVKRYKMKMEIGNKLKILFVNILVQNSDILFVPIVRKFVIDNPSTIITIDTKHLVLIISFYKI